MIEMERVATNPTAEPQMDHEATAVSNERGDMTRAEDGRDRVGTRDPDRAGLDLVDRAWDWKI